MAESINGVADSGGWTSNVDTGWNGYYNGSYQADIEGTLYQWSAAMNGSTTERAQGVCPTGWHVPSDCEWMYLENTLGMTTAQQQATSWRGLGEGTQLKWGVFRGRLAGLRNKDGRFTSRGVDVSYWSSSRISIFSAYIRNVYYGSSKVLRTPRFMSYAFSVRCLKD
jgi:uncharacterized protein (TIGR02145 family)